MAKVPRLSSSALTDFLGGLGPIRRQAARLLKILDRYSAGLLIRMSLYTSGQSGATRSDAAMRSFYENRGDKVCIFSSLYSGRARQATAWWCATSTPTSCESSACRLRGGQARTHALCPRARQMQLKKWHDTITIHRCVPRCVYIPISSFR